MEWKRTRLYSIVNFTCPYCHEGAFFVSHPYDLKQAGDLHKECAVCHRRYSIEPGFYYGAMYVAYALAVAWSVTMYVAMAVLTPNASLMVQFASITIGLLLAGPLLYALSKITWANLFFSYRGVARTQEEMAAATKGQ
ncbi:MAG: DUF983 domain-containing protein [Flavobacteriales bacterium]|nr:DUF983 domain-containing protein [Flavobacteriales bacterium]